MLVGLSLLGKDPLPYNMQKGISPLLCVVLSLSQGNLRERERELKTSSSYQSSLSLHIISDENFTGSAGRPADTLFDMSPTTQFSYPGSICVGGFAQPMW